MAIFPAIGRCAEGGNQVGDALAALVAPNRVIFNAELPCGRRSLRLCSGLGTQDSARPPMQKVEKGSKGDSRCV